MERKPHDHVAGANVVGTLWLLSLCAGLAICAGIGAAIGGIGWGAGVSVGPFFYRRFKCGSSDDHHPNGQNHLKPSSSMIWPLNRRAQRGSSWRFSKILHVSSRSSCVLESVCTAERFSAFHARWSSPAAMTR
jgi:hypothetical protein